MLLNMYKLNDQTNFRQFQPNHILMAQTTFRANYEYSVRISDAKRPGNENFDQGCQARSEPQNPQNRLKSKKMPWQ